ncbi:phosphotransferase family protein [Bacillus wiedmannii]|uniref:phosphotransferase family protein n=1 Tax=Bacillus wiedmannii TaxID=1890302 RepID=UPI000BF07C21|nr:phosphotransferase [Bacillus wiedmannii]PEL51882.1 hypothetical protein CN622_30110 [Bacillus wiedmannii]PEO05019.1 hypothetical protein CN562_29770 [Bacillus wiedmannii]PEP98155.1 hypothetical protein CN587_30335 [Bacillus wiedmannii]
MLKLMSYLEIVDLKWLNERLPDYIRDITKVEKKIVYRSPVTIICKLILSSSSKNAMMDKKNVLLKIKRANSEVINKELIYYNKLAPLMNLDSRILCYEAASLKERSISYLLMEDLSESHYTPDFALQPYSNQCMQVADALASLHASCWNKSGFLNKVDKISGDYTHRRFLTHRYNETREIMERFIFFMGDRLSNRRQKIYYRLLESSSSIFSERFNDLNNLTFVHGDAHFWNFLYPKADSDYGNRVRLIDWEYWDIGIGCAELAYTFSLWLYPEQRKLMEPIILDRYYKKLILAGVENYSWGQCKQDYKLGILQNMFLPSWHWNNNERAELWWNHLERSFLAFDDLKCKDLL